MVEMERRSPPPSVKLCGEQVQALFGTMASREGVMAGRLTRV